MHSCIYFRSPAHMAVVIIFAIAVAQREGQSMRGTKQLCSLVNIRGLPNENSPGREASWRVASTKEVLVSFEKEPRSYPARMSVRAARKFVRAWADSRLVASSSSNFLSLETSHTIPSGAGFT